MKSSFLIRWSLLSSLTTLASCGGGGGGSGTAPPPPPPPPPATTRGSLLTGTAISGTLTASTIDNASVNVQQVNLIGGGAKCDVTVVKLVYATIKPQDSSTATKGAESASAGLIVPGAGCPGPWPLLSHQHGTAVGSGFSLTSTSDDEVRNLAAYYGSQGYAVVIPDYHGYGASSLNYHPYLQASNSAAVVIDAVRAARNWLSAHGFSGSLGTKLFLDGTSEGGYVTMAAQRDMEAMFPLEFSVTASVPASGPYNLGKTMLQYLTQPDAPDESKTPAGTLILEGFQYSFGDVYSAPSQVYNSPFAAEMGRATPLMSDSLGNIAKNCRLPFNLKDTDGTYLDPKVDPATCPGAPPVPAPPLLTTGFVADYLNSASGTSGGTARLHAEANNLLQGWQPVGPMTVCYGDVDPMATPNALDAKAFFHLNSAHVEDIETDNTEPIKTWVQVMSVQFPPGAGYHGNVEAPACTSFARHAVFDLLK